MAENLTLSPENSKKQRYEELIPQIQALIEPEENLIANLANIASALRMGFGFFWVGFYLVEEKNATKQLCLAPFQGDIACTRIAYNRGVCGTAWAKKQTLIVPDVEQFEGHIACSSLARSEIVVPILHTQTQDVVGVLDVDSQAYNDFDSEDQIYLEQIAQIISQKHFAE
jgi:L-methionine (R)-S-oxide reductase